MKLNVFLRFYVLLGCGLFISCQNTQSNVEQMDKSSQKVLEKIKYPKESDNYLEKNRNKRAMNVNDRSFKILKSFYSDQELPNPNYKSFAGPNNIREMKIFRRVVNYENKNEILTPKTLLELDDKEYENEKSSKHFNKNPSANRIRRQLPKMFRYTGSTETKKRISYADKFLKLDEKEREELLEKVFNEIKRKLNKPELGIVDNKSLDVKPQLLIVNSKSKPNRERNSEIEPSVSKAVKNPRSGKTYAATPSGSFNDAIETVQSLRLKTNPGINLIGQQTGRSNVNTEHFTKNSKNFSKREDKYQTEGMHLTTFTPEASKQKSLIKNPLEVRRAEENKPEISSKTEITTNPSDIIQSKDISSFLSEKLIKKRNRSGQPQLYKILRNTPETNNRFAQNDRSSDSSKMSERMTNNSDEDGELLEYIKSTVNNCLQQVRRDKKEEKEKTETKERNRKTETSDSKENYPKETSPELTKQLNLFDLLNSLNPDSPAFQLLRNILQLTPINKPNILLGDHQKARAENSGLYRSPLMAEENYLDEVSSEETGNNAYDMILQTDLKNLDDFVRTYSKPDMGETRFDPFWGTDLLDELFI